MCDKSLIKDLVPVISLLIAGLSIYLAYSGRRNFLKQNYYSKKIEGYLELQEALIKLIATLNSCFEEKLKDGIEIEKKTRSVYVEYQNIMLKYGIIFDNSVVDQLVEFNKLYNSLTNLNNVSKASIDFNKETEPFKIFKKSFLDIILEIRKCLGSSKINDEIINNIK